MTGDAPEIQARIRAVQALALASYLVLIALTLAWEGWMSPKGPPGMWLTIKSLPLLAPLFGLLRSRPRSFVLAALLVLLYLMEGLVVAWTGLTGHESSPVLVSLACFEVVLAAMFFLCATYYVRWRRARGATLD